MSLNRMTMPDFSVERLPSIHFGAGTRNQLPGLLAQFGTQVLLVTGRRSFKQSPFWAPLLQGMSSAGLYWREICVETEPSPQWVDAAVREFSAEGIQVVLGIGGGSVLDGAKAIAGLLPHGNSVMDHLEGVGPEIPYKGPSTPLIAVPTTAGTGSEATKNAVLSVQGKAGFKKSFRHVLLVPQYAVVDPDLLASCPPALIAANGMDALTQLLESYVSSKANAFTDALALSGLRAVRDGLLPWYSQEASAAAREAMAYAALLSGITLAQVGLGSVHGLASPLGALFPIPHGVVCGTLVAVATEVNIQALQARDPAHPALKKYADVGRLFSGEEQLTQVAAHQALTDILHLWTQRLALAQLSDYGVGEADLDRVVAGCRGSSMQTNPIVLEDREVRALLARRL